MTSIPELIQLAQAYEKELPPAPAALVPPVGATIARWIDHTILKPEATVHQVKIVFQGFWLARKLKPAPWLAFPWERPSPQSKWPKP